MTESRKEYMKQYMAERRANKPVNTDVNNSDVNKLSPEEMLTDVNTETVNTDHMTSLEQNLRKWSWCYTNESPSKAWIEQHKLDCRPVTS